MSSVLKIRKSINEPWIEVPAIVPNLDDYATKDYVDDAIENIDISGGNSGSSNVYVFEKSLRYFTDNDKAKIQEIFDYMATNGKMMECELWYPFTSSNPVKIISVVKASQGLELFLADTNDGYKRSIYCVFSNGVYNRCYQNEQQKGGGWRWRDDSGLYDISSYSIIKVVGYYNGDTDAIGTFLITTSNGNTFDNEYGTHYYSTWAYEMNMGTVGFYNEGSSLSMSFNSDNGCTFNILGYYYWA